MCLDGVRRVLDDKRLKCYFDNFDWLYCYLFRMLLGTRVTHKLNKTQNDYFLIFLFYSILNKLYKLN